MIRLTLLALVLFVPASAFAQVPLERTDGFERSFAESFYIFDACGDGLAGRMYRRALADRFAACPFTPAARTRYSTRIRAQGAKARKAIEDMIDEHSGLPVQLGGMGTTCRAHQADEGYRRLRTQLEAYAAGSLPASAILPAPCDAEGVVPGGP